MKHLVRILSKKHRFRIPFENEQVKGSQTLVKSEWEHFRDIFSSLWENLNWKISQGCFVTHWLPITSIPFKIERIRRPRFKCNDLKNQKLFLIFLINFWNLREISKILNKKIFVIATLLRNFQAVKELVRLLSQKQCFRTLFESQHVKESETLVKTGWEHFHHIFSSIWESVTWKISPLVIC